MGVLKMEKMHFTISNLNVVEIPTPKLRARGVELCSYSDKVASTRYYGDDKVPISSSVDGAEEPL